MFRIYEVEGTIPFDTTLTIQVFDYDRGLVRNELIGQTQIDIENRYFTKYRAKCGLPKEYKKCKFYFFIVFILSENFFMNYIFS